MSRGDWTRMVVIWLNDLFNYLKQHPTSNNFSCVLSAVPLPSGVTEDEILSAITSDARFSFINKGSSRYVHLAGQVHHPVFQVWADKLFELLMSSRCPVPLSKVDDWVLRAAGSSFSTPQKLSFLLTDKRFVVTSAGNDALIALQSRTPDASSELPSGVSLEQRARNPSRSSNRVSRSRSPPTERHGGTAPGNSATNGYYDGMSTVKRGRYNSRSRSRTRSRSRSPDYRHRSREEPPVKRAGGGADARPYGTGRESPPPRRRKRSLSRSPSTDRHRGARGSGNNANSDRRGVRDVQRGARDRSPQRSSSSHSSSSAPRSSSYYVPEGSSSDSDDGVDVKTKLDAIMRGSVPISDGMKRARR
jgi:hypothetical protein